MLVGALLLGIGFAAGTGTAALRAQDGTASDYWEVFTRSYAGTDDKTWDAYLLNPGTGELYFVNQDVKTLVADGIAKGSSRE